MPPKQKFDVHPSIKMVEDWIAGLKAKTGRTVEEWVDHIRKDGPATVSAQRDWLKSVYGLGTNSAWWLVDRAGADGDAKAEEDTPKGYLKAAGKYVQEQYDGKKKPLRPIFDELLKVGRALGTDVKVCPCKTMVPLYRGHVFANITPSTNTRVDLGLALAKHTGKIPARLIDTGGKARKDRITHRIPLSGVGDIDADLKRWLERAYALDG